MKKILGCISVVLIFILPALAVFIVPRFFDTNFGFRCATVICFIISITWSMLLQNSDLIEKYMDWFEGEVESRKERGFSASKKGIASEAIIKAYGGKDELS
jgi:hypothetical protein